MNAFKRRAQHEKAARLVAYLRWVYEGDPRMPTAAEAAEWGDAQWELLARTAGENMPSSETRALVVAGLMRKAG